MKAIIRIFNQNRMKEFDLENLKEPFEVLGIRFIPKNGGWYFESTKELINTAGEKLSRDQLRINDIWLIDEKKKLKMLILKKRSGNPAILKERAYKIGRKKENILSLQDWTISAEHCVYYKPDQEHIYICDLNSTNGTFVNLKRIKPDSAVMLKENDTVNIGSYSITIINDNGTLFPRLNEQDINVVFHPENTGHDEEISRKYFADIPQNIVKYAAGKQLPLDRALKVVISLKGKAVLKDPDTLKSFLKDLSPSQQTDIDLLISTSKLHYFDDIVICEDKNLPYVMQKFSVNISSVYAKPVVEKLGAILKSALDIGQ